MFNILKIFKKKIKVENKSFFVGCSGSFYSPIAFEVVEGFIVQKSTKKIIEAERQ